ncbi:hypothetical protein HJ030_17325 [Vibrio parahaemolyticus]|uniref:hypothetical protein n=1 Tax=Vibrio parahaemolyticus TaxID=670 RepID=UPI00186A90AF|nr:hypothetical protein [Vibrio parahaemolyticus]MBE4384916.1 hypothetical protein [Vibrio parahaemolyticus]MEA5230315.1 hypothetical protein [Vibrio parahaemolyticus]
MARKFQIKHAPLSVTTYGILVYPGLSHLNLTVPDFGYSPRQPFKHLELGALATTLCEIVNKPFDTLVDNDIRAYMKLINHMQSKSHTCDEVSSAFLALIKCRLYELQDIIQNKGHSFRLGSLVCGDCGMSSFTHHEQGLTIKSFKSDGYIECDNCGAYGLINNKSLVGVPTNEFTWIKHLQILETIASNVQNASYTMDELTISLLNISSENSVFDLNPTNGMNALSYQEMTNHISRFGRRSQLINNAQYAVDKTIAKISQDGGNKLPVIEDFILKAQTHEKARSNTNIENLRELLANLKIKGQLI